MVQWRVGLGNLLDFDDARTGPSTFDIRTRVQSDVRRVPGALSRSALLDERDHVHRELGTQAGVSRDSVFGFLKLPQLRNLEGTTFTFP